MANKAVIGLGFGDEGKGLVTNYLCLQNPKALVVRYSGGQQAGHTVIKDDIRHVFSNFGSGTLNGNPTYWSEFCTVDPIGVYQELQVLLSKGIKPLLYIDAMCPVTTPMEKRLNQTLDMEHGTCGCGVWRTHLRERNGASILFEDLAFPSVLDMKLKALSSTYPPGVYDEQEISIFKYCCNMLLQSSHVQGIFGIPEAEEYIFESSQGLLLDPAFGFYPHVTASSVGSANILKFPIEVPEFYLVTRAYQTRHGNGPMTNAQFPLNITPNPVETNVFNQYQLDFRTSVLDLELLMYGASKDFAISTSPENTLVITCLDQMNSFSLSDDNKVIHFDNEESFVNHIANQMVTPHVLLSHSPRSECITHFK